jgi:hypothetical protein
VNNTDKAQQLHQQISDAVADLHQNTQWRAMLDLSARMGSRYSSATPCSSPCSAPTPPALPDTAPGAK